MAQAIAQVQHSPYVDYRNLCNSTGRQEIICPTCLEEAGEVMIMTDNQSDGYRCPFCGQPQTLKQIAVELSELATRYHVATREIEAISHKLELYRSARDQTESAWGLIDAQM